MQSEKNRKRDFREFVLEKMLEKPGAVKDIYLNLHPGAGPIEEGEIEWFRKTYVPYEAPLYSFTFIARGEFCVHFVNYGMDTYPDIPALGRYARANYQGYVDEFHHGDVSSAPTFKYAVIVFA